MEQTDFDTTIYNIGDGVALSIKKYLALGKYSKFFKLNISE